MTARAVIPASVARAWAREWSALKEGRAADWLAAVRHCYRSEPWKVEPFMAYRAREGHDDPVVQATVARARALDRASPRACRARLRSGRGPG
jgi:hypothetical protein